MLLSLQSLDLSGQSRNNLEQVADDTVVSDVEDAGILVSVDGDDAIRAAHTSDVLDRAGDTAGDVELGTDGLTGLADLVRVSDPAGVDCCTGSAYDAAQKVCELFEGSEALGAADTTSTGDDDVCAFKVNDLTSCLFDNLEKDGELRGTLP